MHDEHRPPRQPIPTLFLEGQARRSVPPTRVSVNVVVKSLLAQTSNEAMEEAAQHRATTRELFATYHPQADVTDTAISVYPEQQQVKEIEDGLETIKWVNLGYRASCIITVEADVTETGGILATAAQHRASVASPYFFLRPEETQTIRRQLQAEAIGDARAHALDLADAAGFETVSVLSVGERGRDDVHAYEGSPMPRAAGSLGGMNRESVEELLGEIRPEPIDIVENVPVRFLLG